MQHGNEPVKDIMPQESAERTPAAAVNEQQDLGELEQERARNSSGVDFRAATRAGAATSAAGETRKQDIFCLCRALRKEWSSLMDVVRSIINGAILALSHHAASHPIRYIVCTVVVSLAILGIGLGTNFDMTTRVDVGLTPVHSVINEQKQWILEESGFPARPHSVRVLIHKQGASVTSRAGVLRAFEVIERVRQTDNYLQVCEESLESNEVGYSGLCHIRGVTLFWNNTLEIFENSVASDVDVLLAISAKSYPDTSNVEPLELMGRIGTHRDQTIVSAQSFLMEILIPRSHQQEGSSETLDDNDKEVPLAILGNLLELKQDWIYRASNTNATAARDKDTDDDFRLEVYFTDHSLEAETIRAVMQDLPLIAVVFVIMAAFTMFIFSVSHKPGDNEKCKQRIPLGLGAVSAVAFSMAISYGLLFIIGVPFTSTTQILPFIVFGIGLDDAFVIFGEFARTDESKDPVARIQSTMEEVGLSIFMTTLTTGCAFALGCMASLPNLYWLSLYAFPTIIVDFFVMITFFVAIIVVDERRIKEKEPRRNCLSSRLVDYCLCPKAKSEEERESKTLQKHADSDREDHDHGFEQSPPTELNFMMSQQLEDSRMSFTSPADRDNRDVRLERARTLKTESRDSAEGHEPALLRQPVEREHSLRVVHHHVPGPPGSVMDLCMKWYATKLLQKPVKILVMVSFVVMSALLAYSASKFTQEFNIYEVLSGDSYVSEYFSSIDQYADRGFVVPEVYFRNVNQSDPVIQQQMEDYIDDLVGIDSITGQPPFFWLRHFKEMLAIDAAGADNLKYLDFNVQMDIFLFIPVFKMLYGDHIIRDPDTGDITASRCVIYMDDLDMESVENQIQAWREQLDVTIAQPINSDENVEAGEGFNFFMWEGTMLYVFEFYQVMVDELISSSIVGWIAVTFISFAFLPHWSAALFLGPIMAVLYIDLIGFLQLCQVHLNAITYFVIVMSVGLLVDFNMHILLRYYESPCATRDSKVKDALQTMGSSVVVGGLSTFLGVVPLLFSTSYLMLSLFFGFWGMVILGILHGCCFLPVFLSICGPLDTGTTPIASMTPDGIIQEMNPEEVTSSVPTSDSSARPHLESDGELSGPAATQKHTRSTQRENTSIGLTTASTVLPRRMSLDMEETRKICG